MPFGKIANLLSFLFLVMSFLLIIQNSLAGQVRMFAVQSGVLAALAAGAGLLVGPARSAAG